MKVDYYNMGLKIDEFHIRPEHNLNFRACIQYMEQLLKKEMEWPDIQDRCSYKFSLSANETDFLLEIYDEFY